MENRDKTCLEVSFEHQLKYYEDKLNIKLKKNYADIEWDIFCNCRKERLACGITELLDYLKSHGYALAILSNSIFSSLTLKKYLKSFGILHYFDGVYSSADITYRKPSRKSFNYVLKSMGIKSTPEVFFIGNKIEKDIVGAKNAKITPILISKNKSDYDGIVVCNLLEAKRYFESNYLYVHSILPYESLVDGPGLRTVIFFQGCKRKCSNCHNPQTWSLSMGTRYSVPEIANIIKKKAKNKKITFSGGEPLLQIPAIKHLLDILEGFDVCLYTGGKSQDVPKEMKKKIHYLKTGPFVQSKKTSILPYCGSSNQRMTNLRGPK